jgi:uncharacterized glyoxalase superfamily protein PhnB
MSENAIIENTLTMCVNYKKVPGALFCEGVHPAGLALKIAKNQCRRETLEKLLTHNGVSLLNKLFIYILLGDRTSAEEKSPAYIGQSNSIQRRLEFQAFARDSKWKGWKNAIVFCQSGDALGGEEFDSIEGQLIIRGRSAEKFKILNDQAGSSRSPRGFYINAVNEFIRSIQFFCNAFGCRIFEPDSPEQQNSDDDLSTFTTKANVRYKAKGIMMGDDERFKVSASSKICRTETNTIRPKMRAMREELQASGVIDNFTFKQNHIFRSASEAAAVICGHNVNAYDVWEGLKAYKDSRAK